MWFILPEGADGISVERQYFACEIRDGDGRGYFRAPDHFAPVILNVPGFALAEPPDGAPADLPRADPERDGAIASLSAANESLRLEISGLSGDLAAMRAEMLALRNERDSLKNRVEELLRSIAEIKQEVDDAQ